jgi:fumarate hydratase class II
LGNDTAVAIAGSQGNFELNVFKPVMIANLVHSARLLGDASTGFRRFLVEGLEANREHLAQTVERSLMLVTALSPRIGYDAATKVAKKAEADDSTLREACLALGLLSEQDFDELVQPAKMARPHADTDTDSDTGEGAH